MCKIKLITKEETAEMFGRFGTLTLDTANINRKFLDCRYGNEKRQAVDIYLPNDGNGPFPAILFLHGGAWSGGNRKDAQILPFMSGVRRGYAVIGVGYRLAPSVRWPDNLFDVKAALRYLAENADTYMIDPESIALTGASAGAQLAMMAAFTQGQAAFEGAPLGKTCTIRAVVDQYGPTDFLRSDHQYDESGYARMSAPDSEEPRPIDIMLGISSTSIPNLIRFVNPIDQVHACIPPVLIQHGRYDPVVPYQQSTELYEKIKAIAGADKARLYLSEELTHADPGFACNESVEVLFDFLDSYLKPDKK
jgi:acetyl esterase/lipase